MEKKKIPAASPEKYYWLKLKKGFYDRHDIKMIKRRFGFEGVVYYQQMLLESVDHSGHLRFSDDVTYDIESLADAIDAEIVTFTKLVRVLKEKKLLEILKDGTYYLPYANKSIGSETAQAERTRAYRARLEKSPSNNIVKESNAEVTEEIGQNDIKQKSPGDTEIEIELDIDKDKSKSLNTYGQQNKKKPPAEKTKAAKEFEKDVLECFEVFWNLYPRKVSKAYAQKIWIKHSDTIATCKEIIAGLERSIESDTRFKGEVQYIPHASTWLNALGWQDEFTDAPGREESGNYFLDQLKKETEVKQIEQK